MSGGVVRDCEYYSSGEDNEGVEEYDTCLRGDV